MGRKHAPHQLAGGLYGALGPAILLRAHSREILGELGGGDHVLAVDELPPGELSAVREIEILGEGVVLPAPRGEDRLAAPDAAGAGEVEEQPSAEARPVLHQMVTVEHQGLHPGQRRDVAVDVAPARLHHPHLGVDEVADDRAEEARRRDEVGVEDRDQRALGDVEAVVERARLVAGAVDAVNVDRVDAARAQPVHVGTHEGARLVGGVIEHLDLQQVARVVHRGDRIEEPRRHRRLVEERELDGHHRKSVVADRRRVHGRADRRPVPGAQEDEVEAVEPVRAQAEEDGEVEDREDSVEHLCPLPNIRHRPSCHALVIRCTDVSRCAKSLTRVPYIVTGRDPGYPRHWKSPCLLALSAWRSPSFRLPPSRPRA